MVMYFFISDENLKLSLSVKVKKQGGCNKCGVAPSKSFSLRSISSFILIRHFLHCTGAGQNSN